MEIEKEALKREGTSKKLSDIQKELADLNDERTKLRAQWESERSLIDEIQKNKDAMNSINSKQVVQSGRVTMVRWPNCVTVKSRKPNNGSRWLRKN